MGCSTGLGVYGYLVCVDSEELTQKDATAERICKERGPCERMMRNSEEVSAAEPRNGVVFAIYNIEFLVLNDPKFKPWECHLRPDNDKFTGSFRLSDGVLKLRRTSLLCCEETSSACSGPGAGGGGISADGPPT